MHDTHELQRCLDRDPKTSRFAPVVTSADDVANHVVGRGRFLLIGNTDPAHKPGQHWVLFFKRHPGSAPVFFDSYRRTPSDYYPGWQKFDRFWRSSEDFQQRHTTVCGDHCLYVARRLAHGQPLSRILRSYRPRDEKFNDEKVFCLIHKRFAFLNGKHLNVKKKCNQSCIARETK